MDQTKSPTSIPPFIKASPRTVPSSPKLGLVDALVIIIGIVVGAGIFRAPGLVASHTGSVSMFFGAWFIGGLVSLTGALCYAELSTTYPSAGGDYHFLKRAFGQRFAFLFAWARLSVIQTGSIALLGFIVGDYLTHLVSLGPYSSSIYAGSIVLILTSIHVFGLRSGANMQKLLIFLQFAGIFILLIGAWWLSPSTERLAEIPIVTTPEGGAMGFSAGICPSNFWRLE
jgi:APA family basic amino acid/polyamine antiporter